MFEELLGFWGNVILLALSLVILAKASDYAINSSIKVADMTGFAKSTVGFILVGFTTSLPELFVVIFAALGQGSLGVAVGNVLGSNVANIALILGICFLIFVIKKPKKEATFPPAIKDRIQDLYFGLFIASMIPLALLYFGSVSTIMGVILLSIFFYNMYQLSKIKISQKEKTKPQDKSKLKRYAITAIIGSLGVVIASYFLVGSASYVAAEIGIPGLVIGSTIVAFGTSAPELATSISAVRKGHLDLAMGNIVGSCFINVTLILGAILIVSPLSVEIAPFSELAVFSLITNLFLWYFLTSEKLSWKEGSIFLFIYAVFLGTSFSI